jgi:hypothetical protein
VNDAGDALVAWVDGTEAWASYRPKGGAWEAPAQLSTGGGVWQPRSVVDDAGDLAVGWTDGTGYVVATRAAGGAWGAPQTVSAGPVGGGGLAGSGQGVLVAAWMVPDYGYHGSICAWSAPDRLSDPSYEVGNAPSVGYAADGTVVVVGWVDDYRGARASIATPGAGAWTFGTSTLGHGSWGGTVPVGAGASAAVAAWADQLPTNPNAAQIEAAVWE